VAAVAIGVALAVFFGLAGGGVGPPMQSKVASRCDVCDPRRRSGALGLGYTGRTDDHMVATMKHF
jgi:hypothetical protein